MLKFARASLKPNKRLSRFKMPTIKKEQMKVMPQSVKHLRRERSASSRYN